MLRWFTTLRNTISPFARALFGTMRRWFTALRSTISAFARALFGTMRRWFTTLRSTISAFARPLFGTIRRWFLFAVPVLGALIAAWYFFFSYYQLFPSETSSQFEKTETFREWYKKALEAYQSAAPLFSAWAAGCIVVGYTLIKDLKKTDRYVSFSLFTFEVLFFASIFDLVLSQAYFYYDSYVFINSYPVFPLTIARHVTVQQYNHLFMLISLLLLAGISFIRKLNEDRNEGDGR
jgi:hypothetical protein